MSSLHVALILAHYDSCLYPPSPQPVKPPPSSPSPFLANLKFVRRLRLLDGWPLIFCELHLAQTSPRPWCILLTAALAAGPRHSSWPRPPPMLTHYRSVGASLTPTSADWAHANTLKNKRPAPACITAGKCVSANIFTPRGRAGGSTSARRYVRANPNARHGIIAHILSGLLSAPHRAKWPRFPIRRQSICMFDSRG